MIRVNEFRRIDIEVQNAIREAFEFGKANEKDKMITICFYATLPI